MQNQAIGYLGMDELSGFLTVTFAGLCALRSG
jgi:hypothetical protein